MEPNRLKLQRYALLGVRARLLAWIEEVAELKAAFPSLQSLASVQAGLVGAVQDIDEPRKRERIAQPDKPPAAPAAKKPAPAKRSHKAKPKTNGAPAPNGHVAPEKREMLAITASSKLQSWLAGRDILNLLAAHPQGLVAEEIARRLRLSRNAAWHRVQVRINNGHVRVVDPTEKQLTYAITDEGQLALDADRAQVTP